MNKNPEKKKMEHLTNEQQMLNAYENFRLAGREHLEGEIQRLREQEADKNRSEEEKKRIKKENKKKKQEENRLKMAQVLCGRTTVQQGPRETRLRAKLTAKLAQRAKVQFETRKPEYEQEARKVMQEASLKAKREKEALRAKLEEDARRAKEAMEVTRAQREALEERLKMFQEKLVREQAALDAAEKRQKEEAEIRKVALLKKKEMEEKLMKEQGERAAIEIRKAEIYARIANYELLRFAELRKMKNRFLENEKQLEILREKEEVQEPVEEVEKTSESSEFEDEEFEVSDDPFEDEMTTDEDEEEEVDDQQELQKILKRDTSAERALKERVLRRLKLKLDKRRMARQQEMLEVFELKNPQNLRSDAEDNERIARADEDRMLRMQHLRGGYRKDF